MQNTYKSAKREIAVSREQFAQPVTTTPKQPEPIIHHEEDENDFSGGLVNLRRN